MKAARSRRRAGEGAKASSAAKRGRPGPPGAKLGGQGPREPRRDVSSEAVSLTSRGACRRSSPGLWHGWRRCLPALPRLASPRLLIHYVNLVPAFTAAKVPLPVSWDCGPLAAAAGSALRSARLPLARQIITPLAA
jgi:hypothetical protein